MEYIKPNFEYEWEEAMRYPEFVEMGKEDWVNKAKTDFQIIHYESIKDVLGNVDLDFDNLEKDKKQRFLNSYKKGKIEIPLVVKFSDNDYDLVGGNTRLSGLIKMGKNPKLWVINMEKGKDLDEKWSQKYKDSIDCNNPKGFSQRAHCQGKKKETKESTGADSAGSFSGPAFGNVITKREIYKLHNAKLNEEEEVTEVTDASSSGAYDVPLFGKTPKGRKNPLKIDGPESIKKSRAVTDPNFPKWGGPKGVFVKVKEKCKKFPYCNQGDINAIELLEIRKFVEEVSKNYGIPYHEMEKIVINEINKIFI